MVLVSTKFLISCFICPLCEFPRYCLLTPMFALQVGSALVAFSIFYFINNILAIPPSSLSSYITFILNTFLKRHHGGQDYQAVLQSLYKDQAETYDASRPSILPARDSLLGLAAAQLKERVRQGHMNEKPIWIDVSTGNIRISDRCATHRRR